jgi:hypothetical protein
MNGKLVRSGIVAAPLAALALMAPSASAATCAVPASDGAQLASDLANVNCAIVTLPAGTYSTAGVLQVQRTVTVTGAGAGQTTLTRTGTGAILLLNSNSSDLTISGVTISGATGDTTGHGIDMDQQGRLNVSQSVITNNSGPYGGGIVSYSDRSDAVTVTDTEISHNTATGSGAGAENFGDGGFTFTRDLFLGNTSDSTSANSGGGALENAGTSSHMTLTNDTFVGNHAYSGGAIENRLGIVAANNITVVNNSASLQSPTIGYGGGISNLTGTTFTIQNSIVYGNTVGPTSPGTGPDCYTASSHPITRRGYLLIGDQTGCTFGASGAIADLSEGTTGLNPMLAPLGPNGGFTDTMALLPGSAALDSARSSTTDPPGTGGVSCDLLDQRGFTRPVNGRCDYGAFEGPAEPTVTGVSPASGSDNNNPMVTGSAPVGTTVLLYTDPTCTGTAAASGDSATFASPGLPVAVPNDSTTTFHARVVEGGVPSGCSPGLSYQEVTPHPAVKKKCKKGRKLKKGKCVKKKKRK